MQMPKYNRRQTGAEHYAEIYKDERENQNG